MLLKLNKEGPFKKDVFRAPGHQGNMRKLIHFLQQVKNYKFWDIFEKAVLVNVFNHDHNVTIPLSLYLIGSPGKYTELFCEYNRFCAKEIFKKSTRRNIRTWKWSRLIHNYKYGNWRRKACLGAKVIDYYMHLNYT